MVYDVITIGTATRDVFLQSSALKVLKDKAHLTKIGFPSGEAECFALGAKIDIEDPVLTTGGGATNAAVTFARQGFKTACIASLGSDATARDVIEELEAEKVTPIVSQQKKHKTGYSTILLAGTGERTVLVYRGAANDLSDKNIALTKQKATWVYITPSGIKLPVIMRLVKYFKKRGSKIAMNPSSAYLKMGRKKLEPLLKELDVVTMNREEAAILTGKKQNDMKGIFKKFDELIDNGIAVMTDGPGGSVVSDGEHVLSAGIFKEKIMNDRTGAGDAFGSGFVAGLAKSEELNEAALREAIRLGSANATAVVEHIGAKKGILTKREFNHDPRWSHFKITKHK